MKFLIRYNHHSKEETKVMSIKELPLFSNILTITKTVKPNGNKNSKNRQDSICQRLD